MKKYLPYILLGFFGLGAGLLVGNFLFFQTTVKPITSSLNMETSAVNQIEVEEPAPEPEPVVEEIEELGPLPDSVLLNAPFTSQAPHGNWDMPYQEACEEASLIIAYNFWEEDVLTPELADAQINQMVNWETSHFGYYKDTDIDETAEIAREYYGYQARVERDFTAEDIKRELANGNPVIIPSAGRELGNPNFTPPGPWYHMLVIVGYDGDTFITNDPGTRNGEGYEYASATLMSAIHNWTGTKEGIGQGERAYLVINP